MDAWLAPVMIVVAGAIGGVVNALITENQFVLPTTAVTDGSNAKIWRPGILGNMAVSAVAALVSWGLYGTGASLPVFSTTTATQTSGLTYSALVGAILVGIGGARWLTAEVDKNLLRGAAVAAASQEPNQALAGKIAVSSPTQAFTAAVMR